LFEKLKCNGDKMKIVSFYRSYILGGLKRLKISEYTANKVMAAVKKFLRE
jgi:hypothetical protein